MSRRDRGREKWKTRAVEMTGHGIGGYRSGCRCGVCRSAETHRKREYRARRGATLVAMSAAKPPKALEAASKTNPNGSGFVEQAVVEETTSLTKAVACPGMVANALAMARILDTDDLVGMHPQAARQLQAILCELHLGTKKKSKGRLASVQQMTRQDNGSA
jgi:hypothetical protein